MGSKGNLTPGRRPCGARVAWWRERASLSRAELAALIGKSAGSVSHYETGRTEPPLATLERIALATGAGSLAAFFEPRIPRAYLPRKRVRRLARADVARKGGD